MSRRSILPTAIIVVASCLPGLAAALPIYTAVDLGTLGGGKETAVGLGINASGQVTGVSPVVGGGGHAFLYSGGTMTDLGNLTLAQPWLDSIGLGINASGQVTGSSTVDDGIHTHAFLYSSGTMTDLGTLGGGYSYGSGINASGQVTGDSLTTGDSVAHAFLYSGGTMTDLGTLGGGWSSGLGINASGQVTGYSNTTGDAAEHAFLYSGGTMYDLNDLLVPGFGTTLWLASAINDSSQIVATGHDGHAYLLTPKADVQSIPEPGTLPLVAAALGCLVGFLRGAKGRQAQTM